MLSGYKAGILFSSVLCIKRYLRTDYTIKIGSEEERQIKLPTCLVCLQLGNEKRRREHLQETFAR